MSDAVMIFISVLLAELGDKTQLATLLFATDKQHHPLVDFAAASGALVASTALAVLLGTYAERYLAMLPLKLLAGLGFIAIGVLTLAEHFKAA